MEFVETPVDNETTPVQTPTKKTRGLLFKLIRMTLTVYVGVCAVLFFTQRSMIYPGAPAPQSNPSERGWAFETFQLPVSGGITEGWYVPAPNARGTVLFSHGNAENMGNTLDTIKVFRNLGFNVVQFDYGGYGNSTGKPSETRCYNDVRAVWNWVLQQKGETPSRMILVGQSLGGAVIAQLASETTPAAVILESTFTSMVDMARENLPFLPVYLLTLDRFQNLNKLSKIHAPILIVHTPEDFVVGYKHGQRLFEKANAPKTFLKLHGPHCGAYYWENKDYVKGITTFLDGVLTTF